jgi:nitroreductase/NAD-dependent dihydropyrimidine dehydrogenase PreA subunit
MISIDKNKCTLCGLCIPVCVRGILQEGENAIQITEPAMCLSCGHCKAVCPVDAPQFPEGNEDFIPVPSKEEIPSAAPFFRFLRSRRSLRLYRDKPVEKEKLKMLMEAGRFAPTGGNRQTCKYVVVSGRKTLDKIVESALQTLGQQAKAIQKTLERHRRSKKPLPPAVIPRQNFPEVWKRIAEKWETGRDPLLHHAPTLVIIYMKENVVPSPEINAAIASMQMVLMAESLGLGTCYIGFLITAIENSAELKKMLKIPPDHRSLVAFTVGYPDVKFLKLVYRNPAKTTWIGEFPTE